MLSDSDLIEAFVSAPTGPDSVSESVVNDLVDDILLEFALGVHRDCKTGKLTMTDCFNLDMSAQQVGKLCALLTSHPCISVAY